MSDIFNNMPGIQYSQTQQASKPAQQAQTVQPSANSFTVSEALPASKVNNGPSADLLETSAPQKRGPIKKVKGFISNIRKTFATAGEYTKGVFKGITGGAVAASVVYTGGSLINFFKTKGAEKAGEELSRFKKVPSKALAAVIGLAVVASNIWKASLNASERRSGIEHRYEGHQK